MYVAYACAYSCYAYAYASSYCIRVRVLYTRRASYALYVLSMFIMSLRVSGRLIFHAQVRQLV